MPRISQMDTRLVLGALERDYLHVHSSQTETSQHSYSLTQALRPAGPRPPSPPHHWNRVRCGVLETSLHIQRDVDMIWGWCTFMVVPCRVVTLGLLDESIEDDCCGNDINNLFMQKPWWGAWILHDEESTEGESGFEDSIPQMIMWS